MSDPQEPPALAIESQCIRCKGTGSDPLDTLVRCITFVIFVVGLAFLAYSIATMSWLFIVVGIFWVLIYRWVASERKCSACGGSGRVELAARRRAESSPPEG
jgi:hypothetical protein